MISTSTSMSVSSTQGCHWMHAHEQLPATPLGSAPDDPDEAVS